MRLTEFFLDQLKREAAINRRALEAVPEGTDTFTHMAHHRGQLTVYLRLNDRPIPSIYGPSADAPF